MAKLQYLLDAKYRILELFYAARDDFDETDPDALYKQGEKDAFRRALALLGYPEMMDAVRGGAMARVPSSFYCDKCVREIIIGKPIIDRHLYLCWECAKGETKNESEQVPYALRDMALVLHLKTDRFTPKAAADRNAEFRVAESSNRWVGLYVGDD